jgi:hypothetical protein
VGVFSTQALNDTRTFNQLQHRANVIQNQLNEGGFSTQALKPERAAALQAEWAQIEQQLSGLYFDIHDDLGYVQDMSNKLAQVIQSRGLPLPPLPMGDHNTLIAQLDNQFQAAQSDLDAIEEVAILYQETLLFQALTKAYVNQSRASKPTLQALRQLNTHIQQHSAYVENNIAQIDTGDPELIQASDAMILRAIQLIQDHPEAFATEGGFQIQSEGSANAVIEALRAITNAKTVAERAAKSKAAQKLIQSTLLKYPRVAVKGIPVAARMLAVAFTAVEISRVISSVCQKLQTNSDVQNAQKRYDEVLILLGELINKAYSPECKEHYVDSQALNAEINKLTSALQRAGETLQKLFAEALRQPYNEQSYNQAKSEFISKTDALQNLITGLQDKLDDLCKICGREYMDIKNFAASINGPNVSIPDPDPSIQTDRWPSIWNQQKRDAETYKQKLSKREAQFRKVLPDSIVFMHHALGNHGGTVSDEMLKARNDKPTYSRFHTDKVLLQSTLAAYKALQTKGKNSNEGSIFSPRVGVYHEYFANPGFFGDSNKFKWVIEKCELRTIYPEK